MPSKCCDCVFAVTDGRDQIGCHKNMLELVPADYLERRDYRYEDQGGPGQATFYETKLSCPNFLTEGQRSELGSRVEEYLEKKNKRQIDYFVFVFDDSKPAFDRTIKSILSQNPAPRKIATVDCTHNQKVLDWTKSLSGSVHWSSHLPVDPIYTVSDLYNSSYFYIVSNESVKLNEKQNPPRPHDICYTVSGWEVPFNFASILQARSLSFRPFLAILPQVGGDGLSGLTLNRKLYSMINSNKNDSVIAKLGKIPEAFPDQKNEMVFPFEWVAGA